MEINVETCYEKMFSELKKIYPELSPELQQKIREHCKLLYFPKGSVILDYDKTCKACYFAVQGLVISRFIHNGREKVSWFMGAGDIIISVASFFRQKASDEKLVALIDTVFICMDNDALQQIYKEHLEFNVIGRRLTEEYYIRSMERNRWVNYSAKERYNLLMQQYPLLFQHARNEDLASYLGMDKATLCREKKKSARGK
ncbi:Crp/Fnr family transcriptional regulator [Chitinophaga barathri]|uniref:Crp/Fnr family transcriptional regulator n=1 Tax=Chitinophaga barathri TaxID=1647451 RepID=A0A3N4MEE8_9BACT|nr:Crp/Fnr family transcriptional regulator [Chitinophaga barathri]RPD41958.1 Crp/Fnr family transcriptional regulator [Chitinophaga barathri]